ncbi:hypothetical protein [Endozoicomonas sp. SESOKO1]|uniref:hypothetical protein n=1 Tax=Endozoicomonas sp. SESOKO1 TaxID=2828742 RepID=UPI002147BD69|nr:hypothetical protein [Endozoicomonas sp. SESOKO1]
MHNASPVFLLIMIFGQQDRKNSSDGLIGFCGDYPKLADNHPMICVIASPFANSFWVFLR